MTAHFKVLIAKIVDLSRALKSEWIARLGYLFGIATLIYLIGKIRHYSIEIDDLNLILAGFFLGWIGFLFQSLSWWIHVNSKFNRYTSSHAIYHHGKTIFTKYVPGKVLSVIGRAFISADSLAESRKMLSMISLYDFLCSTIVGLILAVFVLLLVGDAKAFSVLGQGSTQTIVLLISVMAVIGTAYFFRYVYGRANVLNIALGVISFALCWLSWLLGFALIVSGFGVSDFNLIHGALFVFSTCISVILAITPGGIGIRELTLVASLGLYGINYENAFFLALISRIWFLCGEIMLFVTAKVLEFTRVTKVT